MLRKACSVRVGNAGVSWVVLSWKKTYFGSEYRISVSTERECPGKKSSKKRISGSSAKEGRSCVSMW